MANAWCASRMKDVVCERGMHTESSGPMGCVHVLDGHIWMQHALLTCTNIDRARCAHRDETMHSIPYECKHPSRKRHDARASLQTTSAGNARRTG
jgi:hypothetical protein